MKKTRDLSFFKVFGFNSVDLTYGPRLYVRSRNCQRLRLHTHPPTVRALPALPRRERGPVGDRLGGRRLEAGGHRRVGGRFWVGSSGLTGSCACESLLATLSAAACHQYRTSDIVSQTCAAAEMDNGRY